MKLFLIWQVVGANRGVAIGDSYDDAAQRLGGFHQEEKDHVLYLPNKLFDQPSPYPWSRDKWYISGDFKLAIPDSWPYLRLHMEQLPLAVGTVGSLIFQEALQVIAS